MLVFVVPFHPQRGVQLRRVRPAKRATVTAVAAAARAPACVHHAPVREHAGAAGPRRWEPSPRVAGSGQGAAW
eukprot:350866-Chlamydomonas_euryale.AAC.2